MNFYLDFEATQYSGKIISIGCTSDNGKTFYALVNPGKRNKIGKVVTNLTGITQEEINNAQSPDIVFRQFQEYIKNNKDEKQNKYYVYGTCDRQFLKNTSNLITNIETKQFVNQLANHVTDYATKLKKKFKLKQLISLEKLVSSCKNEEIKQEHNALSDAELLKYVFKYLEKSYNKQAQVPDFLKSQTVETYIKMTCKEKAPVGKHNTSKELVFNGYADAINYLKYNFHEAKNKPGKLLRNAIDKASENHTSYFGREWEISH